MINRAIYLFKRYCAQHAAISQAGFPLLSEAGETFGYLDRIILQGGRLTVGGWTLAEKVGLISPGQEVTGIPRLERKDVPSRLSGGHDTLGFHLDTLALPDYMAFWIEKDKVRYIYTLPSISRRQVWLSRWKMVLPFMRDGIRALPWGVRWALRRDPRAIAHIKTIFGLNTVPRSENLNHSLFVKDLSDENSFRKPDSPGVSIILPVYNAFELLPEVLDRVLRHTDLPWRLILIEDCSSDTQVRPWLRDWYSGLDENVKQQIILIENAENRGFVGSVNHGFKTALQYEDHVVLLNSDAFVPDQWASRLIRPLLEHDDIATVTPLSNDAEIFSIPVICQRDIMAPGEADAIDRVAQKFSSHAVLADAPTGVGFCMAIHADYLKKLPDFDTIFGRGYGEEVDWCQKARELGGRNVGSAGLFVEHRGGASFGSAEKTEIIRNNSAIISRRYPNYDQDVQDFIGSDPLTTPRLALAVAWAAKRQEGTVPVYLAHDMGGGAEHYLQDRIKTDLASDSAAFVLRVGGTSRWQIELHCKLGVTRGKTDDTEFMQRLLGLLQKRHVIYSCGVGDLDPTEIPQALLDLASGPEDKLEILIHDYFLISPSYTLVDSNGSYHGVPDADTNTDPSHEKIRLDGSKILLSEWREAWAPLIDRADCITAFSDDSRSLVTNAYPQAASKIVLKPHKLLTAIPRIDITRKSGSLPAIGVLGNIGFHKGAAILRDLSKALADSGAARLVVIGNMDPAYPLAAPAIIHGTYDIQDISVLVARYGISCWFVPSICPETFSYTTHEVLATGLPVWSFDLGAQGDAVSKAVREGGQGGVIPLSSGNPDIGQLVNLLTNS